MDLLKRRLRDKISGLQNDTETFKARLDDEKRMQANLKRCKEKLSTKLEGSFTQLYRILEHYKQELDGKVDALFSHHRQAVTKQNKALRECLGSVNKACADAEELLKESDKSTFLAAHNKISQRLEECFVDLLMLDESDSCSITLAGVESLEKKVESFCLEDQLPPFDTGVKKVNLKENASDQEFKPPMLPISSPLTPTVFQTSAAPSKSPFEAASTSVHTPFVFNSPPPSVPVPSSTHSFFASPVSLNSSISTNFISSPLVSVSTSFSILQSSVSSVDTHCPASTLTTTSTTGDTSAFVSLVNVASISESVPKVTLVQSQSTSVSETKPSAAVTKLSMSVTKVGTPIITSMSVTKTSATKASVIKTSTSMTKTQISDSVSTTKGSSLKATPASTKELVSVTTTSSKVATTKNSTAAINTTPSVKKPKTITSKSSSVSAVAVHSSKTNKSSSLSAVTVHSKHRTVNNVKIGYLSDVKQGTEMECVVTEVASPSEFWIQPVNYELIRMMNNIEFYYAQLERKGDHGGIMELPKIGDFCCARYSHDSKWYRARVLSVDECGRSHRVVVLYVDYGNQEEVPLCSLRPLDRRFAYLPCQAIKCSLKVKPYVELSSPELKGSGIPQWPEHTKKWFKSLLTGKHVMVMFLTANSSNHAQVDIAISREMFLESMSCLHGVLSITEGIKQFIQSTHFFALFGLSSFMCVVKLAVFNGDKWPADNLFCGPSVFTFPTPAPLFMHPFSSMPSQHSFFPIVKCCNQSSLPVTYSPGFIQPLVSPTSSLNLSDETSPENEPRCHSEKLTTTTQKSVLKKRTASLSGLGTDESTSSDLPVDLQCHGEKASKLSSQSLEDQVPPECRVSTDATLEATVPLSVPLNDSSSSSVVDVTTVGLDCGSSLSISSALSHSSNSSTPSSQSFSSLCDSNSVASTAVSTVVQSLGPVLPSQLLENDSVSSVPSSDGHCEVDNLPQTSSPLSTIATASKSPECNKNTPKAMAAKDDCIKFHTIAALPLLSSVISNDSDHYSVIVSHVVSPSEFYLNFASDAEEVKNFDSFQQSLHDHYSTESEVDEDLSENLTVGVICSAKYTDDTWNRGIIRDIQFTLSKEGDEKKSKYLVQYIDYGNYHWVPIDNIRSLKEEFLSQPVLTIRCSLSVVIPGYVKRWQRKKINLSSKVLMTAAGSEDDMQDLDQDSEELCIHDDQDVFESAKELKDRHQEWSQEATDRFVRLTDGKVLVAALNEEVMMLSWDDVLEVELIDTNGATDVIIADDLVSRGLARYKTSKSTARDSEISYQDQIGPEYTSSTDSRPSTVLKSDGISTDKVTGDSNLFSPTEAAMDAWNPMESHFLSNWNLYREDTNNSGRGSFTFRARDKHDATLKDPAMVSKPWKAQIAPLPAENTCIPIVITAVYSPVKFWAQLLVTANTDEEEKDRNEYEVTLTQLCEEMNKQYSHSVFKEREPEMIAHGELVAALSPDDQCWYRAVLKDFDDNTNRVLVAFVDYGDTAWILEANVRRLHPKFTHLPIQAVECTLDGLKVNEEVNFNWAVQAFLEIVKDKAFAGHVIERDTLSHRLSLELYDSGSSGALINLKNTLLSKKIAMRTTTAIGGTMGTSTGHKKNLSSLPG